MKKIDNYQNIKKLNKERFTYVMTCLVGHEVTIHMKDGNEIRGLFHSYNCTNKNDKKEIDISLNFARVLPKNDKVSGPINKVMLIPENNYQILIGKNVRLDLRDPDDIILTKDKFKIDADISEKKKHHSTINRELKRWICDDYDEQKLKLEHSSEPWDQFEHNRKLYGVTTTYKEEIYTTNLDINKIPHHVKIHADKIAKELEKRGMHLDPEDAENDDVDEEELFGAVRQNKYKNAKYKKEENKIKNYQGNYHSLTLKDIKEKMQTVKRDEKKYPSKQKPESCAQYSSNDENNYTNKKNKASYSSKKTPNKNAEFIGINALNLEPALPKKSDQTRAEWISFKNQTKNKNKKDKTTEKQEFLTASKELNERLANKMNGKKDNFMRSNKEHTERNHSSGNRKNISSNLSGDKSKFITNESNENKPSNIYMNNANYNNNIIVDNPNIRPQDLYYMNYNMKNNMISHMDIYPNVSVMSDSQNPQMYSYANDPNMFKNDISPIYNHGIMGSFKPNYQIHAHFLHQNMKMVDMLNEFQNSVNMVYKDYSNDELSPFPIKLNTNKLNFKELENNVIKYSKNEDCIKCDIGFGSTHKFSYRNILGEIPPNPIVNMQANNYSNMPIHNISNMPMKFQFIPIMSNINGQYVDTPLYFNPYMPNFYANNIPINSNNPFILNIPNSIEYHSHKNMHHHIYPIRSPHIHSSHLNLPVSSCLNPNMNIPIEPNSLNMMNNPSIQNSNLNLPTNFYTTNEMLLMNPNPQKYTNHQMMHLHFLPQYPYQNFYTSSHGVN